MPVECTAYTNTPSARRSRAATAVQRGSSRAGGAGDMSGISMTPVDHRCCGAIYPDLEVELRTPIARSEPRRTLSRPSPPSGLSLVLDPHAVGDQADAANALQHRTDRLRHRARLAFVARAEDVAVLERAGQGVVAGAVAAVSLPGYVAQNGIARHAGLVEHGGHLR